MKKLVALYKKCKKSDSNFLSVLFRFIFIKLFHKKQFLLHQCVKIKNLKHIETNDLLEIGINDVGFMHQKDRTLLNVQGKLKINGKYFIGRGCRIDIGKDAVVKIGNGGYINCNTKLIIQHGLTIGDNSAISWDCQFLDEDFHEIYYENKKESDNGIVVGNNVWIGCGVKIYKGTVIPNGTIIASDSIVRGKFITENTIIAGNPAKVIKQEIKWKY